MNSTIWKITVFCLAISVLGLIASNKSQKFNDETYNIFNPKGNDNNYLDIIQNEDDTNAEENEEIDTDLVK